ncbi:MAG: hypothetical protein HZA46_01100, partial [Planctomycetales bacterium]|nr:hypothetical protein [Planctomycetales bacterium]
MPRSAATANACPTRKRGSESIVVGKPTDTVPRSCVGMVCRIVSSVLCLVIVSAVTAAEPTVVIERCNLFDPESGKMLPERTIVIRGTQIVRVSSADEVGD